MYEPILYYIATDKIGKTYVGLAGIAKELLLTHYIDRLLQTDELIPDMLWEIDELIEHSCIPDEHYENIVLLNDIKLSLEQIYRG